MNRKQFQKFLDRDSGACYHCGVMDDTLIPQHRLGRGAGGSRSRDVPSNILTLCSWMNNEIEVSAEMRATARAMGWSLTSSQPPADTPAFNLTLNSWVQLDDLFALFIVERLDDRDHFGDFTPFVRS
jgi:hypothetical protein